MTHFESQKKFIPFHPVIVFDYISDFNNLGNLFTNTKINDWQSDYDTCSFKITGIGFIGLQVVERQHYNRIKYSANGKTPFNFFLFIDLLDESENNCSIKISMHADLNPMLKLIVSDHITRFLDLLTNSISGYQFQE